MADCKEEPTGGIDEELGKALGPTDVSAVVDAALQVGGGSEAEMLRRLHSLKGSDPGPVGGAVVSGTEQVIPDELEPQEPEVVGLVRLPSVSKNLISSKFPERPFWWHPLTSEAPRNLRGIEGQRSDPKVLEASLPFFLSHIAQALERAPNLLDVQVYSSEPEGEERMVRYYIGTMFDCQDLQNVPEWISSLIQFRDEKPKEG